MTELYSLAKRLEVDDRIILKAVKAEVENQTPKTVTSVQNREDKVRVEVEGPQGGEYAFEVDRDGNHTAYHIHTDGNDEDRGPLGTVKLVWTSE
ncbi:hypothetical protein GCM10008995_01740 [Halobellus salinus]|uniref:Uncharacterized protein n=1 Tax=Halobellus salinus TaxID=931585 RepID=A0A830EJJ7_9EURY|nr:hypothetical protein [Halobellus salinus]GGI95221.1 hypothetical protein GCM10008995_01740 [Halobellus salinus]SMP11987.1 hypothetical protein SAMN06265347_10416 [Halobellus salinus]